jgi:alkylation response protein AidB-like acyl-CoA dehydrogenase
MADGGLQLPFCVFNALMLPFNAANIGTMAYPFLTIAAGNMLKLAGSTEQQKKYLKPMLEGRYTGTMNLSEPQAGSSLADISTKAVRRSDGKYLLKGTKMWISAGEHTLSDNIVHMVLAKIDPLDSAGNPIENSSLGTKNISLFIVPKYHVNEDGSLGNRNDIELAGLNHKMGYRSATNCVLNYGVNDACVGELLGKENEGLMTMFLMMNEARIGVGFGAAALGYAGYAHSLSYAKQRLQGRLATNRSPNQPPVAICEHPDVKRMLLVQKSYVEGALALCFYGAFLIDKLHDNSLNPQDRDGLQLQLDVLTPVIKSWPSEWCLEANKWAIQILGGYGYTRDFPVEQIYRDNRLNMIHEGTNGIQSLDLLTRKVCSKNGKGFLAMQRAMESSCQKAVQELKGNKFTEVQKAGLLKTVSSMQKAISTLATVTKVVTNQPDADLLICNSHEYLNMFGRVMVAWRWLEMELAALLMLQKSNEMKAVAVLSVDVGQAAADSISIETLVQFVEGKILTSHFYFAHELPKIYPQAELLMSFEDSNVRAQAHHF